MFRINLHHINRYDYRPLVWLILRYTTIQPKTDRDVGHSPDRAGYRDYETDCGSGRTR